MTHLIVALALAAGPSRPPSDIQDLVYLTPSGPVIIRLHLRIDGKPFRQAFDALINDIFDGLDTNRDGVLSEKEAARVPVLGGEAINIGGNRIVLPPKAAPRTALTRTGLAERYAAQGVVPFQLGGPRNTILRDGATRRTPADITRRLIERLDTNKDGRLDAKELASAERLLLKLDADEDELLSVDELMDTPPAGGDGVFSLVTMAEEGPREFVALTGPESFKTLGRLAERIMPPGRHKALEQAALAAAVPDAELTLDRLKGVVKASAGKARAGVNVRIKDGLAVVTVGAAEITLGGPAGRAAFIFGDFDVGDNYKEIFKGADRDKNGYLDRKEAASTPFGAAFDAIDADGDGMLFEKEVLAWSARQQALQARLSTATLSLAISEQGQGLFDLLDLNRDGVLSVREMRRAPEVLKKLGVKTLAAADVPRQMRGDLTAGGGGLGGFNAVFVIDGAMGTPPRPTPTKGPEWFRRMDRNGDGDLSRAEWLGTKAEFDRADADGDGLLSLEEAEAYEKRARRKAAE